MATTEDQPSEPPDPILLRRSYAEQIAMHLVANWDEVGPHSLKEWSVMYGCSDETMRRALQFADSLLAAMGKTLTSPDGRTAWRRDVTDEQRTLIISLLGRISAMANELKRYTAKEIAVAEPEVQHFLGDVTVAVELLVEQIAELQAA